MRTINRFVFLLAAFVATSSSGQVPLGSQWTYQGSLTSGGAAISGFADFEFRLFDAAVAGNAVGALQSIANTAVDEGLFTVQLDFGVGAFNGEARWLQIAVRSPAGSGSFEPLSPRQPLTGTPYSLQTRGLFVNNVLQVGVGTTAPTARLHVGGGDVRIDGGNELHMFNGLATDVETVTLDSQSSNGSLIRLRNNAATSTVELRSDHGNGEARGGVIGDFGAGILTPIARLHVRTALDDARPSLRVETLESAINTHTATLDLDGNAMDAFFDGNPSNLRLNPNSSGHVLLGIGGGNVGVNEVLPEAKVHISGASNASVAGGGLLVVEHVPSGNQLAFDGNELLARSGGTAIPLHLNASGGDVTLAENGAGDVGIGTGTPQGTLHVRTTSVGVDGADTQNDDLVIEDSDARLALYSSDTGNAGSMIALAETSGGVFQDQWAMIRETSSLGDTLFFTFGASTAAYSNPSVMMLEPNGSVYIQAGLQTNDIDCVELDADSINANTGNFDAVVIGPSGAVDDLVVHGAALVTGDLFCGDFFAGGTKSFRIDDPRDPANRYLQHYCHEGPEPQNVYNGTASLDASGEAAVELPSYFQSINRDARYSLTPIGAPMPNLHVMETIDPAAERAVFRIAGGVAGKQVSWEVKAIRNDPYMRKHGISVEIEKEGTQHGRYLTPELYGQPPEMGMDGK